VSKPITPLPDVFSPRAFNDDKIKAKKKVENSSG